MLCIYNNNPYGNDPKARDKEVRKFRQWLVKEGIRELALAYHGSSDYPKYTFAMVIDAGEDRLDEVVDIWQKIVSETPGGLDSMKYQTRTHHPI